MTGNLRPCLGKAIEGNYWVRSHRAGTNCNTMMTLGATASVI